MSDEGRHDAGPEPWWEESWGLDFVAPDGALGGFVRLALHPNRRRAWCWVYVADADGTVVVRDHDVPLPPAHALLARSDGLWCELVCETPMEHWSIGVEAFGVRLDDPLDGVRGERGLRLPVGLDLEWESTGAAQERIAASSGYAQPGLVHGDVLLADDVLAFTGVGLRTHGWGPPRWWTAGWHSLWCMPADARRADVVEGRDLAVTASEDGLPRAAVAARTGLEAAPLAHAVIPLPGDEGRPCVLVRSLVRCTDPAQPGRSAHGWLERAAN